MRVEKQEARRMNPERNKDGMSVNVLMQFGLWVSALIPVVLIAILGVVVSQQSGSGHSGTLLLFVAVCAILSFLGVITVLYYTQRKIKDRLIALVNVCSEYANGDRTVRASVNGDDELAHLSMSLNTLLDTQGNGASGANIASGGSSDAAALQAQIEKLLQEVSAVGDGDLRVQAEVTPDTLGVLADSFNYMIEELAKVVGRVQSTAVQVTNATRRILDRSTELSHATETQVGQISQASEAVEALAVFIQNVARNAMLSAEAAREALHNANSGQQSVRQTIEGMMLIRENVQETSKKIKRLGERSNEIGEIVRIIEDIADQTNLLALNAAIQSAMAGEHGRGFAVVADEIRLLAERSTESTKRIDTLVKSIQGDTYEAVVAMEDSTQEVVKGSQLADEAGRSLNSIYSAVERQAQMIESIARAANDQTSVSEAVAIAMSQISDITRQTNAGTQEAAANVTYLADLAEQLRASVSTFHLPDHGNEVFASFPGMTSVSELPNANQFLPQVGNSGMDNDWTQGFSGNFPPLPEHASSGSLVALSSRNGQQNAFNGQQGFDQYTFGNQPGMSGQAPYNSQQGFRQQPYGSQPGFDSQQSFDHAQGFGNQPNDHAQNFGGQQSYGSQPAFSGQQSFDSQPSFGGQPASGGQSGFGEQHPFDSQSGFGGYQHGNQPGFGDFGGFDARQNFGSQPLSEGSGNFQGQTNFPGQNQPSNPNLRPQSFSGQLPPAAQQPPQQAPGRTPSGRLYRSWDGQPQQYQPPYGQDQPPFPSNGNGNGNGQFGQ
jgi:methyl-accepting chemotaxis protein